MTDTRELREAARYVTPGPWELFEGCSWRRIGNTWRAGREHSDCAVLAPTKASDGHPDLTCSRGNDLYANLRWIVLCSPDRILPILDALDAEHKAREDAERKVERFAALSQDAADTATEAVLRAQRSEARIAALETELREARAKALEEAATHIEPPQGWPDTALTAVGLAVRYEARRIRALAHPDHQSAGAPPTDSAHGEGRPSPSEGA